MSRYCIIFNEQNYSLKVNNSLLKNYHKLIIVDLDFSTEVDPVKLSLYPLFSLQNSFLKKLTGLLRDCCFQFKFKQVYQK